VCNAEARTQQGRLRIAKIPLLRAGFRIAWFLTTKRMSTNFSWLPLKYPPEGGTQNTNVLSTSFSWIFFKNPAKAGTQSGYSKLYYV
jgi:hypothetical protein